MNLNSTNELDPKNRSISTINDGTGSRYQLTTNEVVIDTETDKIQALGIIDSATADFTKLVSSNESKLLESIAHKYEPVGVLNITPLTRDSSIITISKDVITLMNTENELAPSLFEFLSKDENQYWVKLTSQPDGELRRAIMSLRKPALESVYSDEFKERAKAHETEHQRQLKTIEGIEWVNHWKILRDFYKKPDANNTLLDNPNLGDKVRAIHNKNYTVGSLREALSLLIQISGAELTAESQDFSYPQLAFAILNFSDNFRTTKPMALEKKCMAFLQDKSAEEGSFDRHSAGFIQLIFASHNIIDIKTGQIKDAFFEEYGIRKNAPISSKSNCLANALADAMVGLSKNQEYAAKYFGKSTFDNLDLTLKNCTKESNSLTNALIRNYPDLFSE